MTEGISKEDLKDKLSTLYWSTDDCNQLITAMMCECKELDPWLPIDENTPKDKPIHLFYPYNKRQLIYQYKEATGWGLYVEFDYQHPTHYKLLSEDPE